MSSEVQKLSHEYLLKGLARPHQGCSRSYCDGYAQAVKDAEAWCEENITFIYQNGEPIAPTVKQGDAATAKHLYEWLIKRFNTTKEPTNEEG